MGKAASADSIDRIVILGQTPAALALAASCAARGLGVTSPGANQGAGATAGLADALGACRLVIDARPEEDAGSRTESLQQLEASLPADAILAVTASYRPVAPMARKLKRPGAFAGLVLGHRPGDETATEIVRMPGTSSETVSRLQALLRRLGKTPIVVCDSPGFFSGRVSGSYLNEAMALVGEGVPAARVESAGVESGMRVGPLAMLDAMSLQVPDEILHQELHELEHEKHAQDPGDDPAHAQADHQDHGHNHDHGHDHGHDHDHANAHGHAHGPSAAPISAHQKPHKHAHSVKSRRMPESAVYVMEKMAHGFRRMGREAGAGFYDYDDDGSVVLWSGLKAFERRTAKVPAEDIRDRLLFIQALEAVRCLDQGIVSSLEDADAGSRSWGFPSDSGGVLGFINSIGTGPFVRRAEELAARYGERFAPPPGLSDLAKSGQPLAERLAAQAAGGAPGWPPGPGA